MVANHLASPLRRGRLTTAAVVSTQRRVGATLESFVRWHLEGAGLDHVFLYFGAPADDVEAMAMARHPRWAGRVTVCEADAAFQRLAVDGAASKLAEYMRRLRRAKALPGSFPREDPRSSGRLTTNADAAPRRPDGRFAGHARARHATGGLF